MIKGFPPEFYKKTSILRRIQSRHNLTNDEWYTTRMLVDIMLLSHLDYLKDKKIYLPCDTENSEFVKFMKDHNLNYKNTSDDYMKHDDLWEWADIIITNPPFSKADNWLCRIYQFKKEAWFIHNLWLPIIMDNHRRLFPLQPYLTYCIEVMCKWYLTPLGFPEYNCKEAFIRPDGKLDGASYRYYRLNFNEFLTTPVKDKASRNIDWIRTKF